MVTGWSCMSCKMWMIQGSLKIPDRLPKLSSSHVQISEVLRTMTGARGPYNLGGSATGGKRRHRLRAVTRLHQHRAAADQGCLTDAMASSSSKPDGQPFHSPLSLVQVLWRITCFPKKLLFDLHLDDPIVRLIGFPKFHHVVLLLSIRIMLPVVYFQKYVLWQIPVNI